MKKLLLFVMAICLSACATVQQKTRLSTGLMSFEYNSLSSQYLTRPTFVSLEKMSNNENSVLTIEKDSYNTVNSAVQPLPQLHFIKSEASSYISLIDKYLKWEAIARSRGDQIEKDIGIAKTWSSSSISSGELKFKIFSGNAALHYLVISFCAAGTCLDANGGAFYFDRLNAIKLKDIISEFQAGKLKQTDVNDVYK